MSDPVAPSAALHRFGYTERQAAFISLVALHSGYFLARQYDAFIGCAAGGNRHRFVEQLGAKGDIRMFSSCDKTTVYHLYPKRIYKALNIENSRNRRTHQLFAIKTKLMTLDLILSHTVDEFLGSEHERVRLFTEILNLSRAILPAKFYAAKGHTSKTVRYFVDRNPIFLSAAAGDAAPIVNFAYIDAGEDTTAGFKSYLAQYRRLFAALENFRLIYVATSPKQFETAGKDFTKVLGFIDASDKELAVDHWYLLEHFGARACHERRDYVGFDMPRINRLAEDLRRFKGPTFDALFQIFMTSGPGAAAAELARLKAAKVAPNGVFEPQILPHSYAFLGEL